MRIDGISLGTEGAGERGGWFSRWYLLLVRLLMELRVFVRDFLKDLRVGLDGGERLDVEACGTG
jgi:hypothetical protein